MIDTNALRKKVLDLAIRGKLVPQNPNDEPASVLLERIREEKQRLIREGKIKKDKVDSVIFRGDDNCYYEKIGDTVKKIELELPEGWQFCRLSLVCWLNNGEKTTGEKLPYLDARTLRGKNEKTFLDNGIIVNEGEKVILVDGENSGEVFIVPYRGYMGSTFKILQIVSHINVEFIKIILDYYKDILKESKTGAAIPHLNKQLLKSIIIGVPPIDEQNRIVSQIQQIMQYIDLLENNQNDYADLVELLKKAILQSAIQGTLVEQDENDEPASILLESIREEKRKQLGKKYSESYIFKGDDNRYYEKNGAETQEITEEIPFDIPNSWEWSRLDSLALYRKGPFGSSLTKSMFVPFSENSIKVYEQKNAIEKNFCLGHYYISLEKFEQMRSFEVFPNDIIVSCAGTIGETYVIPTDAPKGIINQALMRIKLYDYEITDFYLLYFDYVLKREANDKGKGSAIKNIPPFDVLKKMLMPIPPLEEQKRIIDQVSSLFLLLKDED